MLSRFYPSKVGCIPPDTPSNGGYPKPSCHSSNFVCFAGGKKAFFLAASPVALTWIGDMSI